MRISNLFNGEIMSGEIICPIMKGNGNFAEGEPKKEIIYCDCPKLRELVLAAGVLKSCNDRKSCLVREVLAEHE